MRDHKLTIIAILCTLCTLNVSAQTDKLDLQMAGKIRLTERETSNVDNLAYRIIDLAGPRLTGSEGMQRGYEEAKKLMEEIGLENVTIDFARKWHRGGWDIKRAYSAMITPYYHHIYPAPVGWTGSTNGLVKSEVVLIDVKHRDELSKYKGKLKNKIVLMPSTQDYTPSFGPAATRNNEESLKSIKEYPIEQQMAANRRRAPSAPSTLVTANEIKDFLRKESVAVIVDENGSFGAPGITFYNHQQGNTPVPCEINITLEAHGLMERLIKNGENVEMEVDVETTFKPNVDIYNVLGDITGCDPELKDEIVLIGAHLDSYHTSGGAGDDAAGCIVMLEAARILKELGVKPRRTIRVALWGGEEMGLHGSSGYVEQYVADLKTNEPLDQYNKISAYFNQDYGPGKFRGIYTQDNLSVNPIFAAWAEPFHDMGFTTVSNKSVGSTDHVPFDKVGIPAFQFIQDGLEWGRGSHKVVDFSERLILDDLRHNAIIVAWYVYNASMRSEMLPRKH